MDEGSPIREPEWDDDVTRHFMDLGRYCVPERELQRRLLIDLVPERPGPQLLIELGCGEGFLAEGLLQRFPEVRLLALDGSPAMLGIAAERLARFGARAECRRFSLGERDWRTPGTGALAVVSSLVLHHLEGPEKLTLFEDIHSMLVPGGVLAIADLVQPAHAQGMSLAADAWDEAVRARALKLDGRLDAFQRFEDQQWNTFRYPDPDDIDHPSGLFEQLRWLEQAGYAALDVHWMRAGQAIFSGWKPEAGPSR
jgi:tRNA (cmo5U34)-methyltransferase